MYKHTLTPQTHVRFQRWCCRTVFLDGPGGWFVLYLILFGPGLHSILLPGNDRIPLWEGLVLRISLCRVPKGLLYQRFVTPKGVTVYTGKGHVRTVYSCFCKLLAKMLLFLDKKNLLAWFCCELNVTGPFLFEGGWRNLSLRILFFILKESFFYP